MYRIYLNNKQVKKRSTLRHLFRITKEQAKEEFYKPRRGAFRATDIENAAEYCVEKGINHYEILSEILLIYTCEEVQSESFARLDQIKEAVHNIITKDVILVPYGNWPVIKGFEFLEGGDNNEI